MAPARIAPRNRIRRFRKHQGLSRTQLAQQLGVSYSTVRRWERGEQAVPTAAWHSLADIFGGAQINYLMGRGEE